MTATWLSTLVLASLFVPISCSEQQVLNSEGSATGVLRRFNIGSAVGSVLAVAQDYDLDIWHASSAFVDVYFPSNEPSLPEELARLPHTMITIPSTVSRPLQLQTDWNITSLDNTTFHETYHPLEEVQTFIQQLADAHPNITRLINLGQSAEGRPMQGLTISTGPYNESELERYGRRKGAKKTKKKPTAHDGRKLGFVIVGAQHAREWIATATMTYLAHALVSNSSETHTLSKLLDHFDFHIIPMPNPDGYDYTWKADRYWYKNRQVIGPYTKCVGLDMNRFGYKWKPEALDQVKSPLRNADAKPREPQNPCSHWYPGTRPFESPEVNNMANWISTIPNVVGFVDLRSYGQMLSSPYSYTCKRTPKDAEDQIEAALGACHALKSVHGTAFKVGTLCSTLYPAYGNIVDWMYAREAIKYSYVAHLRDTGTYGFSLPEKWIRPTGEETVGMIEYIAKFIAKQAKST
ncbi:peptidase M14 [Pholiota conissans]|uniref:Peptidase M14 n=1 Tax=Pholiota conissans TaxID=109636 RepID=A0A9P6CSS2_9AGAR|nr:peptidase M14 [Pholiota conissans]